MEIRRLCVEKARTIEEPKGVWKKIGYIVEIHLEPNENVEDARGYAEMLLTAWLKEQKPKLEKEA